MIPAADFMQQYRLVSGDSARRIPWFPDLLHVGRLEGILVCHSHRLVCADYVLRQRGNLRLSDSEAEAAFARAIGFRDAEQIMTEFRYCPHGQFRSRCDDCQHTWFRSPTLGLAVILLKSHEHIPRILARTNTAICRWTNRGV